MICVIFLWKYPNILALVVGNIGAAMAMSWMGWVDHAFPSFGQGWGLTMILLFVV